MEMEQYKTFIFLGINDKQEKEKKKTLCLLAKFIYCLKTQCSNSRPSDRKLQFPG